MLEEFMREFLHNRRLHRHVAGHLYIFFNPPAQIDATPDADPTFSSAEFRSFPARRDDRASI
jgi:hypothetical protein